MRKSILLLAGILAIGLSSFAKVSLSVDKPAPVSKDQLKKEVLASLSSNKLNAGVTVNFHEGKPALQASGFTRLATPQAFNVQPCYEIWIFEYDYYDSDGNLVAIEIDIWIIEYECPQ